MFELAKIFGEWLWIVVHHWEVIVITGAIPFVIDMVDRLFDWKMPKKLYAIFVGIGLVLAMFMSWKEERELATVAQRKVDEMANPKLVLSIDEIGAGELEQAGSKKVTAVLIIANIINKGAPSIADGWKLRAVLTDGRSAEAFPDYMPPKQTINGRKNPVGGDWKMSTDDALYIKASTPIQRGNKLRGVLMFSLPTIGADQAHLAGTKYILSCFDVDGNRSEFVWVFSGKPEEHRYFQGLNPIPH